MFLIDGKSLICKTSKEIMIFSLKVYTDTDTNQTKEMWMEDFVFDTTGLISYAVGNLRIQVTNSDAVYFYIFDILEMKPKLENIMPNQKKCTQFIQGRGSDFGVSYVGGEPGIVIIERAFIHSFKAPIVTENLENCLGLEIASLGIFLVTNIDKIGIYDSKNLTYID